MIVVGVCAQIGNNTSSSSSEFGSVLFFCYGKLKFPLAIRFGGRRSVTMANCGSLTTTVSTSSQLWAVWKAFWNTHCLKALTSRRGRVRPRDR
jgi:hypothetical protein